MAVLESCMPMRASGKGGGRFTAGIPLSVATHPSSGFLRMMPMLSARCMRNRRNVDAMYSSAWSTCFTLTLTRTEFTEPSIRTRSAELRQISTGLSRSSG